jgi:preprotein translocase subunit Sec61beta
LSESSTLIGRINKTLTLGEVSSGVEHGMPKTAKKRKKKGEGPMPSGGAGLIRFFEDETPGIKVGPMLVVIFAAILVGATVAAHVLTQVGWISFG